MAALSWDEIVERGKQHNKTVICEVEKRGEHKFYKVKCGVCGGEKEKTIFQFNECKNCLIKNNNSLNKERFIIKVKKNNGDKYNYDLVEYINTRTKVKIKCNDCNNIFMERPSNHLSGKGCPNCKKKSNKEDFVFKSNNIHPGKYDYSLTEYINCETKVKIICKKCNNIFMQRPSCHLSGKGCPKCAIDNKKSNKEDFSLKSYNKHPGKYDYSLVQYINTETKVKIICKKCNNIFLQTPQNHLSGKGCPKCNESKGEIKVARYLSDKNIKFTPQKTFQTLRNIGLLKCDFYLEDLNLLIEYDGEYHHKPVRGSTTENKQKNLEVTQRRDKIKNEWARKNNIPLLRIPYWDFDRIEELIDAFILEHTRKKEVKQLVLDM
jgi:hypothetical protein